LSENIEPIARSSARFCPDCRRPADAEGSLCGECGGTLRDQGYCPICERSWRLDIGERCPKHDVALEPEPEPDADAGGFPAGNDRGSWVTVAQFADTLKAEAPRIRLEAEGIPTFVEGARMGSRSMYTVATGGVKLQVPETLVADARVVLAQTWAPVATEEDDLDDAWEELAPEPGESMLRALMVALLVLLFGPLILVLVAALLRH
jgi:hypothetical protein